MIHRSRNGSRIPNPYVDNAQPGPGATWATIGDKIVRVMVNAGHAPALHTRRGPVTMFYARTETDGPIAYGKGPSEAVARLDEMLSVYDFS